VASERYLCELHGDITPCQSCSICGHGKHVTKQEIESALDEKLQALQRSRASDYGPWEPNMTAQSEMENALLNQWKASNPGKPLPPWWSPLTVASIKLCRMASGNYKEDNFDDIRVYLSFVQQMQEKKQHVNP